MGEQREEGAPPAQHGPAGAEHRGAALAAAQRRLHLRSCPGMLRPDAQVAAPRAALGACQDTKSWCRVTTNAQQQHCKRAGAEREPLLSLQASGLRLGMHGVKLRMNGHLIQVWQQFCLFLSVACV